MRDIILSEYQHELRNARVYLAKNNQFCVEVFDGVSQEQFLYTFPTEQQADNFAEEWVLKI